MTTNRSTIFLGDLMDALRILKPSDDKTREQIAALLGIKLAAPTGDLPHKSAAALPVPEPREMPPFPEVPPAAAAEPISDAIPVELTSEETETGKWISDVKPLPTARADDDSYVIPELEPLLLPQWTRGILSASLATRTEDGMPDIESITETLAKGEILRELPRHSSPTLRRGLQLLIDKSQAMTPFARDQNSLQKEIVQLAGLDRVEIMRFAASPLRGAGNARKPWPEYRPPLPGTPVVLVTDLGICQPMFADDWASPAEWLSFCQLAHQAGCPLIAFVPYQPSRWPPELTQAMTIIQWDRKTNAGTVRSIVGQGLDVT